MKSKISLILLLLLILTGSISFKSAAESERERDLKKLEDKQIQQFSLPKFSPQIPVYKPRLIAPQINSNSYPRQRKENLQPIVKTPRQPSNYQAEVKRFPSVNITQPQVQKTENNREKLQPDEVEKVVNDQTLINQYSMTFNRSPVVGNSFRLQGLYSSARLGFTRPRSWKLASVKTLIRFQHSPALFANRSNLTILINGTSIGSVPLNRPDSQIGEVLLNIPPERLQDFNEISMVAQQHNSNNCQEEDAGDQTLWTEILPDSQLIFNYRSQPISLDFSRYPYPFFDSLSLDTNQITYLQPRQWNDSLLTATARYNAALGRLADFRPIDTRTVKTIDQVQTNQKLIIIGTPEEQPALKSLILPFKITGNQVLDGDNNPLPADVGLLMLTTTKDNGIPVLVATGNGAEGVSKAVQFLVQSQDRKIGNGKAILVNKISDISSPPSREWSRYLPEKNNFKLSDLKVINNKAFSDVTVRGVSAPPIEFDFRALPDDRFMRGSYMSLNYSYGPQINPRTSAVEVLLDGVFIGGERLTEEAGAIHKTLNINLPENLIKPTSKIKIAFHLNPRESGSCGKLTDQQLTGTIHGDTSFNLKRENAVVLPDLKLLPLGFPFVSPQDISNTAMVLPDSPSPIDVITLLEFSKRLGMLSQADSVKLKVYTAGTFPSQEKDKLNLVGIGIREKFPFPEVFESKGFKLDNLFSRQKDGVSIQTLPDETGVIKEIISPWRSDRVLLALTAQTENGLNQVRELLAKDPWFYQLKGDTALISTNTSEPSAYDPDSYNLEFLQNAPQQRLENTSLLAKITRFFQENWLLLPITIVILSLIIYGISQLYIKRVAKEK